MFSLKGLLRLLEANLKRTKSSSKSRPRLLEPEEVTSNNGEFVKFSQAFRELRGTNAAWSEHYMYKACKTKLLRIAKRGKRNVRWLYRSEIDNLKLIIAKFDNTKTIRGNQKFRNLFIDKYRWEHAGSTDQWIKIKKQ